MRYLVEGKREDGRGGDGLEIEASSKEDAESQFLVEHPGWVITQTSQPG